MVALACDSHDLHPIARQAQAARQLFSAAMKRGLSRMVCATTALDASCKPNISGGNHRNACQ